MFISWALSTKPPPGTKLKEANRMNMMLSLCNLMCIRVLCTNISKIILSQTIKWLNLRWYVINFDYEEIYDDYPFGRHHVVCDGM